MREAASKLMPPELAMAAEPPKSMPVGEWLRGPLKDFLKHHIRALKADGIFVPQRLDFLVDQHLRASHDYGPQLWSLLALAIWQSAVMRGDHTAEVSVCRALEAVE
jgi:asparagine synthase (glutamine-hydrolysing)